MTQPSPWHFVAHPEVWVVMLGAVGGYVFLASRARADGHPATRKQAWLFAAGLGALWLSSDWPVHDLAERYLYSAHMFEHMVISLVAPPLLLLGIPDWMQRRLLTPRVLNATVKRICRPLPAAIIFNAVIAIGHAPFYVNATLEHHALHFFAHLLLFAASMVMWFPVVNRMPEYPQLGQPAKMVYLFVQSIIPNFPVAFLTFGTGVIYSFYAHVPRPFPISAIEDQQLAGAIMKIGGTLIIWATIAVQWFRWYASEETHTRRRRAAQPITALPEVLTWDDVETELSRTQPAGS